MLAGVRYLLQALGERLSLTLAPALSFPPGEDKALELKGACVGETCCLKCSLGCEPTACHPGGHDSRGVQCHWRVGRGLCWVLCVLDEALPSQAHGLESVSGHLVPSASSEHSSS